MKHRTVGFIIALGMLAGLSPLAAQQQKQRQQQQELQPPGRAGAPRERRALEMRLRQEFGRVVKNRLGLTDAQMTQLQESNQKFEPRRRQLLVQETRVRRALRVEIASAKGASADSAQFKRTDDLLAQWSRVQRERLDLNEEEQRELALFLSPIDRAKYLGLQDQFRQRIDQLLQGQAPGSAAPGAARRNAPARRRPNLR